MKIHRALTLSICLCALCSLAGCGLARPKPVPPLQPPQVIELPIPAYQPVDRKLTAPIDEPPAPAAHCDYLSMPAVCVLDALLSIEDWRGVVQKANTDRAATAASTPVKPP